MQDRAFAHPKIEVRWNTEVTEVLGEDRRRCALRDTSTGDESRLDVQGLFVAIGYKPNTDLFIGQLDSTSAATSVVTRRPGPRSRASSWPETSTTTATARRSPPPVTAARPPIDAERWLESVGEIQAQTATNW